MDVELRSLRPIAGPSGRTMKYDNVGFVLLQYFLYIPGMMLFR